MRSTHKDARHPLRVLTNMRLYTVAGIAQYVSGFIAHNEMHKDFDLYGIDILRPDESPNIALKRKPSKH